MHGEDHNPHTLELPVASAGMCFDLTARLCCAALWECIEHQNRVIADMIVAIDMLNSSASMVTILKEANKSALAPITGRTHMLACMWSLWHSQGKTLPPEIQRAYDALLATHADERARDNAVRDLHAAYEQTTHASGQVQHVPDVCDTPVGQVQHDPRVFGKPVRGTLRLPTRALNAMSSHDVVTIGQLTVYTCDEVARWRNVGVTTLFDIRSELWHIGLHLAKDEWPVSGEVDLYKGFS